MLVQDWLSLAVICILGAFSPGPSLMVILSITASNGRKSGFSASFGHGLGVFIYALLSATGLSIILNTYSQLLILVQVLGALFLLYLGIRTIRSLFSKRGNSSPLLSNSMIANRFTDGFLIAIFNPKIAAFFLSLFSQFLFVGQTFIIHLGMALLAGSIDTLAYLAMVTLASTSIMFKFLSTYKKSVEVSFGLFLIILSISLCFKIIMNYI
jgi:threonine/homoserine/homoserine lactone efflux protein